MNTIGGKFALFFRVSHFFFFYISSPLLPRRVTVIVSDTAPPPQKKSTRSSVAFRPGRFASLSVALGSSKIQVIGEEDCESGPSRSQSGSVSSIRVSPPGRQSDAVPSGRPVRQSRAASDLSDGEVPLVAPPPPPKSPQAGIEMKRKPPPPPKRAQTKVET